MKAFFDLETYSEIPIRDGTHRYAEKAEVLLFAWAIEDGPVNCWDVTSDPMPSHLRNAIEHATAVWWHNSHFDLTVLSHAMPDIFASLVRRSFDTMVQAYEHGLPGSLGTLCDIFKLDDYDAKDKRGKQLIQLFCKPQPVNRKIRRATKETHPDEWREFIEYAKSDIRSMRVLHGKMPRWNYPDNRKEVDLWRLDQSINRAGIYLDLELANGAIRAVDRAQKALAQQAVDATNGAISAATQRDKLLEHVLAEYGVKLPDMQASTLERRIADPDLPEGLRDLLNIRLQASTSSTSKYRRALQGVSSDGYIRGLLQFCGAARTGRWAGRLLQPQNFVRPTLKQSEIDFGIEAIKADCEDLI